MSTDNKLYLFYVTFPDQESALSMARQLVEKKLAGCCNLIPHITSIYTWNGQLETSQETVLIIKTLQEKIEPLKEFIQQHHPYQVPCILNLNSGNINDAYFEWIQHSIS